MPQRKRGRTGPNVFEEQRAGNQKAMPGNEPPPGADSSSTDTERALQESLEERRAKKMARGEKMKRKKERRARARVLSWADRFPDLRIAYRFWPGVGRKDGGGNGATGAGLQYREGKKNATVEEDGGLQTADFPNRNIT